MAKFTRNDTTLLQEAYSLRLLRENAPHMTVNQVINNLDLMTESEVAYINTVADRILNEFSGGIGALGSALAGGAKKLGGGLLNKAKQAGGAALQGAKQFGSSVAQGAKAGAGALADNAKNIYETGQGASNASDAVGKAQSAMQQLIDLVTDAQNQQLIQLNGEITDLTLADIIEHLSGAKNDSANIAQKVAGKGLGHGVMDAAKKGFRGR